MVEKDQIIRDEKGRILRGTHISPKTEFKKGHKYAVSKEAIKKRVETRRKNGWFKDPERTKKKMGEGYKYHTNSGCFKKDTNSWNIGKLKKSKYCCDCGKEISRYNDSIRCCSCNVKGKRNPMYGVIGKNNHKFGISPSLETLKKMSATNQGIPLEKWKKFTGREPYDQNFSNKFKRAVRKRDNQICMLCRIHREKLNRALDVHHIDYNKEMSIPQNCVSLCINCHRKTNFDRNIWTKHFQSLLSKRYDYQYSETGEIIFELNK